MNDKRTVLIAGATGTIGRASAVALASRGASTVLLARSAEKLTDTELAARQAVSDVTPNSPPADVTSQLIDFSEMGSVRAAAAEILSRFPVVDGLVLSVGAYIQNGPTLLPSGHEAMFATNVMGPFLLTELLTERLHQSKAIVVHVIAPFHEDIDWMDLESLRIHKTGRAFNRTKTCNWAIAGELARRYGGSITSVAFDPTFVIDKTDPTLSSRWPSGFVGLFWKLLTLLIAKPPSVAGEAIAKLVLSDRDRPAMNGGLFKLEKRMASPDKAMTDEELGKRLWDELARQTQLDA